ncbi:MAG: hypothetical protein AB4062_20950 [Crocosphaera sp.]
MNEMEYVGTVQAAFLLKICPQRLRQLLAEERVEGASSRRQKPVKY